MRSLLRTATALAITVGLLGSGLGTAQAKPRPEFDIQAHRGGLGLTVESTLAAFSRAMELGVTTLELDIQITEDGRDVVTHDRRINPAKCADTAPAFPDDPEFPYAGKYVKNLTFAQVRTMDCGSQRLPNHPDQQLSPGATMPTLAEVFDLARRHHAWGIRFNVETKVEAAAPHETAPREQFVRRAAWEVTRSGFAHNTTIQSFDWGALMLMRRTAPWLRTVALTQPEFLQVGQPGKSPWLGGLDIDDFDGSPVRAVRTFGASALSPVHGNPQGGSVTDPDYVPFTTKALVDEAHRAGLRVVPWTINDKATMHKLIDDGVDGIITDYPDRLREVAEERGFRLPRSYPLRR
ncbi:glycerophosphoryl diester phosphodiesterase [Amycolatopsis arida]|uniref:Glycerophosphoryl diester phosphodiesterase n=1 Tax=Amycolatopsis arida TaxID=587909 RepID=A0A1I5TDS1_9PSEU|nr:glycerophosphodiester phosphodiesterase family protein [Amycolatopsis arida]TDX96133.1 glycerophosphoryl diester phosphodiesterase [Amycolatopsis arida]SFP81189.1 glycerophosphoryl diester phosphodiesterase [Amycolatopsis arida]